VKRLTTAYERILSDGSAENAKRGKRIRSGGGWMRDILFQAKLKDTNYWVEGFYCSMRETTYCCEEDYKRHPVPLHHLITVDEMTDWGMPNRLRLYEINPETLCQYTGLCDKNGKKSGKMTLYSMGNIRLLSDMENIQQDFMLIFQRKQITEKIWATGTKK
jgi:hypothetical protein